MKYLNGSYYVEVKDQRQIDPPTENNILKEWYPTKSLRT